LRYRATGVAQDYRIPEVVQGYRSITGIVQGSRGTGVVERYRNITGADEYVLLKEYRN
jgi:hypothetical protein